MYPYPGTATNVDDEERELVRHRIEADDSAYFSRLAPGHLFKVLFISINGYSVIAYAAHRNSTQVFLYLLSDACCKKSDFFGSLRDNLSRTFQPMIENGNFQMLGRTFELLKQDGLDVAKARFSEISDMTRTNRFFSNLWNRPSILYFLAAFGSKSSSKFYDDFFELLSRTCKIPTPTYKGQTLLPSIWQDKNKNTVVHTAVEHGNYIGAKYFIEKFGLSPLLTNKAGQTALHLIPKTQNNEAASLLEVYATLQEGAPSDVAFIITDYLNGPDLEEPSRPTLGS